jgi:membrane-associated protease RseP (regulator of RpoE activity)
MKRYLTGLALLALAVPARADAPPKAAADKPVTVPFELLKSGHMTVKVKVNGKGPYRLIFDTGAPITLLNNKIAKEAGLLKNVEKPLFAFFGTMGEVKVKELQVGGQKAADVTAIVMDHPTVEAISQAYGPIDGIVGFPFFARFKVTLDYQAKTMTFVPSGFKPPDVMKAMMTALMTGTMGSDDGPKVLSPAAQWGMLVRKETGDEADGVSVTEVLPGGAADAAGLKAGDRLLTLDGRWTDTLADLYAAAGYVKPGKEVAVVVKRGGKDVTLKVKPAPGL